MTVSLAGVSPVSAMSRLVEGGAVMGRRFSTTELLAGNWVKA